MYNKIKKYKRDVATAFGVLACCIIFPRFGAFVAVLLVLMAMPYVVGYTLEYFMKD